MSKEKTNKVVHLYDELTILEDEIITIKEKLNYILSKNEDCEFILLNMMFVETSKETERNDLDDDGNTIRVSSESIDELYIEVMTEEAIKILNTMLSDRKTKIESIEKKLNSMFK